MLKKRIIPCLDIKNGRAVKGVNFTKLVDAGDPTVLAKKYINEGADELVFLDITATIEQRDTLYSTVQKIAKHINIPFTVGGGIHCLEQAKNCIAAGADKVSINSAALSNPKLIEEIAKEYGSQSVVIAIDTKLQNKQWKVFANGGTKETNLNTVDWAKSAVEFGAGEILLTSMDGDGTKDGYSIDITNEVSSAVKVPLIASGGAGKKEHFSTVFQQTQATGALAASIFHFGEIPIQDLKKYLSNKNIKIR